MNDPRHECLNAAAAVADLDRLEARVVPSASDVWLLERYRLFVCGHRPALLQAEVTHPPWLVRGVEVDVAVNQIGGPLGNAAEGSQNPVSARGGWVRVPPSALTPARTRGGYFGAGGRRGRRALQRIGGFPPVCVAGNGKALRAVAVAPGCGLMSTPERRGRRPYRERARQAGWR